MSLGRKRMVDGAPIDQPQIHMYVKCELDWKERDVIHLELGRVLIQRLS